MSRYLALSIVGALACGDDGGSGGGSGGGGRATDDTTATDDGAATTLPESTTAADLDSSTDAGTSDSTSGADSSTADGSEESSSGDAAIEVSVTTYPHQPMVVDVSLTAEDWSATVVSQADPGVRATITAAADGETQLRVRGLMPDTLHTLTWSVEGDQGQFDVQTELPLPGFVPSFPVQGDATGLGGYLLFDLLSVSRMPPASVFAVDQAGITRWHLGEVAEVVGAATVYAAAQLRPDGSVLFNRNESIYIVDELGDEVLVLDPRMVGVQGMHHDVVELDNGNFLTLAFTFRDIEYPDLGVVRVAGDLIIEVTPDGDVVWEWDAFDHLDPQRRRPGFEGMIVDRETGEGAHDWTHSNGIVYEPATDSVLLSIRHQDWLVRIDRQTGAVLWRFGDGGDFTLADGTWPYHQHSPQWQADDTLLLYDNGIANPNVDDALEASRAVRYVVDQDAMVVTQVWEDAADDFMAPIAGDADRLADGTILVTDSSIDFGVGASYARIRKVDEARPADPQWSLTSAVGTFVYRCVVAPRLPGELPD